MSTHNTNFCGEKIHPFIKGTLSGAMTEGRQGLLINIYCIKQFFSKSSIYLNSKTEDFVMT